MSNNVNNDRYGVMGNPVEHSLSPLIHQAFAKQVHHTITYEKIFVPVNDFEVAVLEFQKQGGKGLNITLPFKQRAYQLANQCSERAKLAEAVNTLIFLDDHIHGDNTDGIGLVRDLLNNLKITIKDKSILIIGASGAARGVIVPLCEQSPRLIHIVNRTEQKAVELANHFSQCKVTGGNLAEIDAHFDIVINATSASVQGLVPEVPTSIIQKDTCCYDMFYSKHDTAFVTWAKNQGAKISVDGLGMLVEQAAESFFLWRGVRPKTQPIIAQIKLN